MSFATVATLGAISSDQWGMFTTAQAGAAGVSRATLTRLVAAGAVERLTQGVYRVAGAPAAVLEVDVIRTRWLALGGRTRAVIASGKSALALHGVGDWLPSESDFVTPDRRTTRVPHVTLRVRRLEDADVTNVDGVPSMTVERAIADLVERWEDRSLIADALGEAMYRGMLLWPRRLAVLLDPLASRNKVESGSALAEGLLRDAGADESWIARLRG